MKGFPKDIATKADIEYLLSQDEYKTRAKEYLNQLSKVNDSRVTMAISPKDPAKPEGEWNTMTIDNPMPLWKIKGFKSLTEVNLLVKTLGVSEVKNE